MSVVVAFHLLKISAKVVKIMQKNDKRKSLGEKNQSWLIISRLSVKEVPISCNCPI